MQKDKIKAYLVTGYDIADEEDRMVIVFAPTPSKAKSIASNIGDFWYIPYMNLRVRREYCMDKYYQEGKEYLDWNIPKDRTILVKELDWYCDSETVCNNVYDCQDCEANEYCGKYFEELINRGMRYGSDDD